MYGMNDMEKVWKWLFRLSKKRVKEAHLDRFGSDIKCPKCKEWFSVSGIDNKHKSEPVPFGIIAECGQCGERSYWNLVAFPFPALCDEAGTPITQ